MNITVGITSYNQRDYLIQAVDSVLTQTVLPAEILIVDDASTDDSPQVIAGYAARYPALVRSILLSRNGGPNTARNQVIAAATGDYLAFLDGDDVWRSEKLARALARLSAPDHPDAVLDNFVFTDGDGRSYVDFSARRLFGAPLLALAAGAAAALGGLWLACRAGPGVCGNDWLSGGVKGVAFVVVFGGLLLALERDEVVQMIRFIRKKEDEPQITQISQIQDS